MSRLRLFFMQPEARGSREWMVCEAGNPERPVFVGPEHAAGQEAARLNDEAFRAYSEEGSAACNDRIKSFDRQASTFLTALQQETNAMDRFTAPMVQSIQRLMAKISRRLQRG